MLRSSLGAAIVNSHVSPSALKSFPPIENDSAENPSASLIPDTLVLVQEGEELQDVCPSPAQEQLKRAQSKPEIKSSPRSFLHTIVELLAGRKNPVKIEKVNKHRDHEPIFDESRYVVGSEEEDQGALDRSSYITAEPRLTLPEVIPEAGARGTSLVSQRPEHRELLPPRHEHKLTGYAIIQPDKFTPEKIQRDFKTTNNAASFKSPTTPPLEPLAYRAHKQGNSAAKLLDRDSKTWADWHDKNPNPDKMSFAKKPSVKTDLNEPQQPEDNGCANGGHPGPCYLQHTGDNYPYAQSRCW